MNRSSFSIVPINVVVPRDASALNDAILSNVPFASLYTLPTPVDQLNELILQLCPDLPSLSPRVQQRLSIFIELFWDTPAEHVDQAIESITNDLVLDYLRGIRMLMQEHGTTDPNAVPRLLRDMPSDHEIDLC